MQFTANNILLNVIVLQCFLYYYGGYANAVAPICCFPKQYEALMFAVNTGVSDPVHRHARGGSLDLVFGMANGTFRTAYDAVGNRTYFFANYTTTKSDVPEDLQQTMALILDYKQNIQYQVLQGVLCDQGPIDYPLVTECIPGNATLLGEGTFGDGAMPVKSYLTYATLATFDYQLVVTVLMTDSSNGECTPVRISLTDYPPKDDAYLIVADVVDVTHGITDTSIFDKPAVCDG